MSNLYRGSSIDASYQVSVYLVKLCQSRSCFRNLPIRNKNCLWRPCLWTDRNGMSNSNRGLSIDASYQVSVHLAWPTDPQLGRKHLWAVLYKEWPFRSDPLTNRNLPIRNKNCLWRPCLSMDRNEMITLYRGPPIDASYQIRFIWPCGFKREEFLKSAN
jgi:hypothetical protein